MTLIDISRRLDGEIAVWPGDTRFSLEKRMDRSQGDSVNLTTLTLSAHTGTHIDSPLHFSKAATSIDELTLAPFWGKAQVVTVDKESGPLFPADLAEYNLRLARRLLVHSPASAYESSEFPDRFVYPSPQLAEYLGKRGVILYGTDAPSVDAADSKTLDGHMALLGNEIAILEWLDLSKADDGVYELAAMPLRIVGGDGSPVRAVLRPL